jgi:hypothetical protein
MFTEEQLKQLREVIRHEMKTAVEPLATKDEVAAVDRKIDALRAETHAGFERLAGDIGGLVNDIGEYIDKRLRPLEKRVDRLEEHVGLPKPQ